MLYLSELHGASASQQAVTDPIQIGSVLGTIAQFRVVRVLGQGGMGTVYLGERQGDFTQTVAIKVLRPGIQERDNEEEILTSLDHPGIVRLLDRGRLATGEGYLVMEFVDGQPIDLFSKQYRLDLASRVRLLLEAAEVTAYAHSKLVLHADLKPQNLLVTPEGEIKLLDFGLARWLHDAQQQHPYFSPGFSAPEQQFGQKLSVASDIFSLGKIGIALTDGELNASPDLKAVLDKACSAEPEDRYYSMRGLAEDLKAWLEKRPVAAYRSGHVYHLQRWAQRNRLQATLAAALAIMVLGSAFGIGVETLQAAHRRAIAQVRLREVAALTGTLQGELYSSLPAGEPANAARRQLLTLASQTLAEMARGDHQDAVLRQELASQYRHLSQLQQASGDPHGAALSATAAERLAPPAR